MNWVLCLEKICSCKNEGPVNINKTLGLRLNDRDIWLVDLYLSFQRTDSKPYSDITLLNHLQIPSLSGIFIYQHSILHFIQWSLDVLGMVYTSLWESITHWLGEKCSGWMRMLNTCCDVCQSAKGQERISFLTKHILEVRPEKHASRVVFTSTHAPPQAHIIP